MITILKDVIPGVKKRQQPPAPQPPEPGLHSHVCPNPACGKTFDCAHGRNCQAKTVRPRCCSAECLRRMTALRGWLDVMSGKTF
jgi:hypothetical protein